MRGERARATRARLHHLAFPVRGVGAPGTSGFSSQPATPTMIAPHNAAQNPLTWKGTFSFPAGQPQQQAIDDERNNPSVSM